MNEKHTPGPWRADVDTNAQDDMRHGVVADCNDLWVAALYRSGTSPINEHSSEAEAEVAANARLIAAAPELLAALRVMLAHQMNDITAECDQARAAIAKATGSAA
jgi:hypothetical protein